MEEKTSEGWSGDGDENGYDAVVVGSGYGGSVAASRMSMAGLKVCLVEKGRKWEAQDFPTDTLKMIMRAVRIENKVLGLTFGPKDALFQVRIQDDSLAAVACGLGGGSLVNAGVMLPTPARARRNPRWPKEWERDWDICQDSASAMLRIQDIPFKFQNGKIIEEIAGEDFENSIEKPLKLSVNFDMEGKLSGSRKPQELNSCLACGNCLSGCPYNAKLSTDKTYLVSAIQAGCTIRTESEVQYILKTADDVCKSEKIRKRRRRWMIFLNDYDFIMSDFVILSAGVFGTTKILFQSQMRGLRLSTKLGSDFSCNGNNVGYLAGSSAPLNAYGLGRRQFCNTPIQDRPGPSISSSYTSSLGFTIQSAVLPIAYPHLLFKGISTYGWPSGYWFLHGLIDKLKCILNLKQSQAMILNAMGYDGSDGKITYDKNTESISFQPPHDPLLPRKTEVLQKITKKLGGILFMSRFRSTSVHLLGGCCASSDASSGVCNPDGQVFDSMSPTTVHPGLYICDASLIPCSVGVNPCLTIAAAAEHVSRHLVRDALQYKTQVGVSLRENHSDPEPGVISSGRLNSSQQSTVSVKEIMKGHVGGMPCKAYFKIKFNNETSEDRSMTDDRSHPLLRGKVAGHIVLKAVEMDMLYIVDGSVDLCKVERKTSFTQYMHYHLVLAAPSGSRYILEGRKIMNPFFMALYAWRESTTMHITLKRVIKDSHQEEILHLKGKLHISLVELLKSIFSLKGAGRGKFVFLFLHSLLRTYIFQVPRGINEDLNPEKLPEPPYPSSTLHEIKAEDGVIISCHQWKCNKNFDAEKEHLPVLLINGYATESYWLPTETTDLIRTLLQEGHEAWLLRPRVHISNPSNDFSIEDIGRYDIPAAMNKIIEFHGPSMRVHVIAHCAGGLAIHIAVMGGHIAANQIASLSCTNSSMYFKLTASSAFKMWLPLLPISMAILGKNKILPLLKSLKTSYRHKILTIIAHLIPRYERCTCDECEVFSGIFGNAFWHENLSPTMHCWLNKVSLPRLPMAGFPHLRKICNAGYIVDNEGRNSYLIHPERMALPTLYISGGRTLLVTPQTTFLAHKYMKLHQPSFRHERVVLEGFGHSDLLIGEESHTKVFPLILSHMKLAEKEQNCPEETKRKEYSKEALYWGDDHLHEDTEEFGSWIFPLIIIIVFMMVLFSYFLHILL